MKFLLCSHQPQHVCMYVYIYLCLGRRKWKMERKRKREVASLLLVSCLSYEQTKPFVRELSASALAWEDDIIFIERNSLSFHCLSLFLFFLSTHQNPPPQSSSQIQWCGMSRDRTGSESQPLITEWAPAATVRDSFAEEKTVLRGGSRCHYPRCKLLSWEILFSSQGTKPGCS